MRSQLILILIVGFICSAALEAAVQDKGAQHIELEGGKIDKVPFPHHQHQDAIGDCEVCHDIFPQSAGVIEKLKDQGKLKKKHVMNKLCVKCHKDLKSAGEKTGPVTCKTCHQKKD